MSWSTPITNANAYGEYQLNYTCAGNAIFMRVNAGVDFGDTEFASLVDSLASLPFVSDISAVKIDGNHTIDSSTYTP